MTETARWKTIATIAVAFSLGNLFATACTTGGGDTAQASSDGASPPNAALEAEVAALRSEVNSLKCFIGQMTDDQYWVQHNDGYTDESEWRRISPGENYGMYSSQYDWHQGPNSDAAKAYEYCF